MGICIVGHVGAFAPTALNYIYTVIPLKRGYRCCYFQITLIHRGCLHEHFDFDRQFWNGAQFRSQSDRRDDWQ